METTGRSRFWALAAAGLVIVLLGTGLWLALRTTGPRNPQLASLFSGNRFLGSFDDTIRRGDLEAAGGESLPFLISKLRAEPGWVERGLAWAGNFGAISWVNDWVSERMAQNLYSRMLRSEQERDIAVEALILLGPGAAGARPDLTILATSAPPHLRWKALAALTAISPDDPAVVSNYLAHLSLQAFQPPNAPPLGWSLSSVQGELLRQFPRIWPSNPAPLDAILPLLDSSDDSVRINAARALAFYGTAASNAAPRLVRMLSGPDRRTHPLAAYALGMVSPEEHGTLAVEVMLRQQHTNNTRTGDLAWRLYAALGPAAHAAVPSLTATLREPPNRRPAGPVAFALWRIQREASPEIVEELIRGLDPNGIRRYQLMSLVALREIGPPASNAVPALRQALSARHATLQREAAEALEAIQGGNGY